MRTKLFSKLSLKILSGALLFAVLLCGTVSYASFRHFKNVFESQYNKMTREFAYLALSYIDGDSINGYITNKTTDENWNSVAEKLAEVVNIADIDYLSVTVPDSILHKTQCYVFHCVSAHLAGRLKTYSVGEEEPLDRLEQSSIINIKKLMLLGRPYTEYEYSAEYNYATTAIPVRDSYNNVVAMLSLTKSMDEVMALQMQYQRRIVEICLAVAFIFFSLYIVFLLNVMIRPILLLTHSTQIFMQHHKGLSGILKSIRNKDELGDLARAIEKMSADLTRYISELTSVTAEKERISTELNVATKIQSDMLPKGYPAFPERHDFDLFASMEPAKEVGGDLYDYLLLDDDHLMLVVGDVSGKGVPAALFMVIAKTLISSHARQGLSPAQIFETTNNQLCQGNESGLFVTCWLGILTLSTGELRFVNAGHPQPILYDGRTFSYLATKPNFFLGGMSGVKYTEHTAKLKAGARLFVYTDGVTEATDAQNVLFGEERLLDAVVGCEALNAQDFVLRVRARIDAFVAEAEQFDDITMLDLILKGDDAMKELEVQAVDESLETVNEFIHSILSEQNVDPKLFMQIDLCVEEIFVNIAHYAYAPASGTALVRCAVEQNPRRLTISLTDGGKPFNPLDHADPDITLALEERDIGGLGIFLTKKYMDSVTYEYLDGRNILTMVKNL